MIGSLQLTRLYDVTNYQFIVEQVGAAAGGMLGGLMDVVKDASSAVIPGSSKPSGLTTRTSTTTTTRPGMPQVSDLAQRWSLCHLAKSNFFSYHASRYCPPLESQRRLQDAP